MAERLALTPIKLTEAEKIELLPSLIPLLELPAKIRENGIFSIKDDIASLGEESLIVIYDLLLSGNNPEAAKIIIHNLIYTSGLDNISLAQVVIYAEVLFFLKDEACHANLINLLIISHLGFEFKEIYRAGIEKYYSQEYYNSLCTLSGKFYY